MLLYITRRVLLFLPSLVVIALLGFILNALLPGDPVMRLMGAEREEQGSEVISGERYIQKKKELGLHLPVFYVSLHSKASPQDLFSVINPLHKQQIIRLSHVTGNPGAVMNYYKFADLYIKTHPDGEETALIRKSLTAASVDEISRLFANESFNEIPSLKKNLLSVWQPVSEDINPWNKYIPVVKFHASNQFHRWLFGDGNNYKGILSGDFGNSYVNGKAVITVLREKIAWTVFFTLGGLLISFVIAIPLGVKAAAARNSKFDKTVSRYLLMLHAIPSFFFATLLLMIFANPSLLGWFPASGVGPVNDNSTGFIQWLTMHLPYFILPLISYAAVSLPFIMRAVRSSMTEELEKDYILTAHAKGLPAHVVYWKHAFPNSLFPLITVTAWIFPAMIGGSAVLETVFSIPGMGLEIMQSIFARDYPVLIAVFTISGILTVTGYLVSDILYTLADPRIRLT